MTLVFLIIVRQSQMDRQILIESQNLHTRMGTIIWILSNNFTILDNQFNHFWRDGTLEHTLEGMAWQ